MENENLNNQDLIKKTSFFLKEKKKILFLILGLLIIIFSISIYYNYKQEKENIIISEKYIKAGLLLKNKKKEDSLKLYKEVITSKNKIYAMLAISNIIENNIENDEEEILELFKILENIKYDKDKTYLVKLKKALFLRKLSKLSESDKLLDEIISSDSLWKEIAIGIKK